MIQLIQFPWSPYCLVQKQILTFAHVPHKVVNIPPSDRSLVWRLTRQRYYQVPIVKDGRNVIFETDAHSQVIAKYLDDRFHLDLFPRKWAGVQNILWRYLENDVEECTFKLNDAHFQQFVLTSERLNYIRYKERKFGRNCLQQWLEHQDQLIADLTLRLHATLVESALGEAGLASAPLHARVFEFEALGQAGSGPDPDAAGPAAGGLRSASGRLRVYLGKGSGGQTEVPQAREDGAVVRQMEVIGVRVEMPSNSPIVLLKEAQGDRYLPIWIGAVEATAIAFAQQGMVSLRPLTHDLFRDVLEVLNVQLRTVNITALRDGIFYADLVFSNGAEVSARPSDSIALALRTGAQIFASEEILDEAGVAIPEEQEDNETEVEKFREFLDTISPEDFGRAT